MELKRALSSYGVNNPTTELLDNFYAKKSLAFSSPYKDSIGNAASFNRKASKPLFDDKLSQHSDPIFSEGKNVPEKNTEIKVVAETENFFRNTDKVNITDVNAVDSSIPDIFLNLEENEEKGSLGNSLFQINNTYIVAQNESGLVIVDQHAAAERIMLEKLKANLSLDSQNLLLPEVCHLTNAQVELLKNHNDLLIKLGIYIEILADDLIVINSVTAMLETCDAKALIMDIIDELSMFGDVYLIEEKIHSILSSIACHSSLRAGKKLSSREMDYLLRKMETTLNIAQCCHGRPSYLRVSFKDLNKFFERS